MREVVLEVDEGFIAFVSPAAERVLGVSVGVLLGTALTQHVHPEDHTALALALGATPADAVTLRWRHLSGEWLSLEVTFGVLRGRALLVARDVSAQGRAELEGRVEQKMEAVGRLAGGVAHDFNNVLSVLASAAAMLAEEVPPGSVSAALVEEIRRGCRRAADVTKQLLVVSGRHLVQPHLVELREVLDTASRHAPKGLAISTSPGEPCFVMADEGQLECALSALLANASESMPEGGPVELGLHTFDAGPLHALPPGQWHALTVKDQGRGMDAGVKAHLFEPFFSTKPRKARTGFGMATVWGVAHQFSGHVRVESAPNQGTTVTLLLPAAAEASRQPTLLTPVRDRTVLLVDDDPAVRWIAGTVLEKAGYRVLQAEDGAHAISVAQRKDVRVDLLLTDVVMPGLDGPQVAEAVLALQPNARVLFMSGFTNDATLRAAIRNATVAFLPKPFSPESLAQRAREVLERG